MQPIGPALADRIAILEDALNQLKNQQVHANAGQEDVRNMMHDVMSSYSKLHKEKDLVDPKPSVHLLKLVKLKIPNIANYRLEKYSGRMAERSIDVIETWLHKWEEAFAICEIKNDMKKIREVTHVY